ncbi:MAG: response regulator [Actinobacteria bacterium]|nr:response regulator [Actinomycetota bacterium]
MSATDSLGRVLLVDDADDLRALGAFVLLHAGYEVMIAASARDALTLLATSDPLPDVVVLDVQMPDLDGWSTLERIRANPATARVPVLMCTVKTWVEDEDRIVDLGPDGHLAKPYSIDELEAAVRSLVPPSGRRAFSAAE